MGKYVHKFANQAAYDQARKNNYIEPWVSYTENVGISFNKSYDEKLYDMPFTIEALGTGLISWNLSNQTLQYSKNGGSWETMNSETSIPVVDGDEIQFKGVNENYQQMTVSSTANFNVVGNIMSLTDGDNFKNADSINESAFYGLFSGCTTLLSARYLKLPIMELASNCYSNMFQGCTNMISAPNLPATTLASNCYSTMFNGCTSLIAAPELPATTVETYCYYGMFNGCTSLITAPNLPATNTKTYCYGFMFKDTKISVAPELLATELTIGCYQSMFEGCVELVEAQEILPATSTVSSCYRCMFKGCTSLERAPKLSATTLVSNCYLEMFNGCSSLNYIEAMFTTTPGTSYTKNWVSGVASTGIFVKSASASWNSTGVNGVPTGWTVQTALS